MVWPTTSLVIEAALELDADLTADPNTYTFAENITSFVFDRDRDSSIVIRRGRQDEASQSQPSSIRFDVDNTDGRFSPKNPVGAYYGRLRRNTPIRVRVNPGTGLVTEFVGYISELPTRWDVSEADFHVPIKANGILRRLGQGQSPLRSALFRSIVASGPAGYWPMEDGLDASIAASGLPGGRAMSVSGTVDFATSGGPPGSGPLPDGMLNDTGSLKVPNVVPAGSTAWQMSVVARISSGTSGLLATWEDPTSVTEQYWRLKIDLTNGQFGVFADNTDGPTIGDTIAGSPLFATVADVYYHVVWRVQSNGTRTLYIDGAVADAGVSGTSGPPRNVKLTPNRTDLIVSDTSASLGHFALWADSTTDVPGLYQAMTGHAGELSGTRFARLCTEESVPFDVAGSDVAAYSMGAQTTTTLLNLLRECEAASEGVIVERRTGELGLDLLTSRENQTVALTLNYATGQVSPPLEPTDDDQRTRNDVTVTRDGGSSGHFVDEDGPLGVIAVGRYDEGVTLNLETDDQAVQHASWRVHL